MHPIGDSSARLQEASGDSGRSASDRSASDNGPGVTAADVSARLRLLPGSTRFTPTPAPTLERPSQVVAFHPYPGRTDRAA
jgi:hypothetical protein